MAIESLQQLRDIIAKRPDTSEEGIEDREHPLARELGRVPGYAWDAAQELPGNLMNLASQIPGAAEKWGHDPIGAYRDFGGGVARGSQI